MQQENMAYNDIKKQIDVIKQLLANKYEYPIDFTSKIKKLLQERKALTNHTNRFDIVHNTIDNYSIYRIYDSGYYSA